MILRFFDPLTIYSSTLYNTKRHLYDFYRSIITFIDKYITTLCENVDADTKNASKALVIFRDEKRSFRVYMEQDSEICRISVYKRKRMTASS